MAITAILNSKLDSNNNGDDCTFNGYLEDYLNMENIELDPVLRNAFAEIQANAVDTKICVGLRSEINNDAISNQIIRYKDVFKLNGKPLIYPYILYLTQDEQDRALLVVPFSKFGFIKAKGLYYCMTEPGSEFIDCKNEIVAICSDSADAIVKAFGSLFSQRAGALQRNIDGRYFRNYDELKAAAVEAAETLKKEAPAVLSALEDRTEQIYEYVVNWFLLKKVLYVQYMVNKNILNSVHEGNVKKQRNQAKLNADDITFMSYSEMWRTTGVTEEAESSEETVAETA
ncbi:MAG: hypothetical protein Q4C20_10975 [Erysipelotrichaceae bacterium]|nr:hypothetical protein [Erysipelotrichaceae bacterium]